MNEAVVEIIPEGAILPGENLFVNVTGEAYLATDLAEMAKHLSWDVAHPSLRWRVYKKRAEKRKEKADTLRNLARRASAAISFAANAVAAK